MKYGVFLARMQPLHKGHLHIVSTALQECDKVLVVIGSSNKSYTLRNPFPAWLRKSLLEESLMREELDRVNIITLPDWSMEDDTDSNASWGRYLYYNIVSSIQQKDFTLYYSDDPAILDSWFNGTEVKSHIKYRLFERINLFEGLSATKIRKALQNEDFEYIEKNCPKSVVDMFDHLCLRYKRVINEPKEDFSME